MFTFDKQMEIVRHVVNNIMYCPYSFNAYNACSEPLLGIRFIKEDNTGVYAIVKWTNNHDNASNLIRLRLFDATNNRGGQCVGCNIAIVDETYGDIDNLNVKAYSNSFIRIRQDLDDFAYRIVCDIHGLLYAYDKRKM